ncbi:MAG: hypothetical protein IPK52_16465 [Chloroflexi bacterium]|nr:hypothetical protein [Chloroflexota bacterium]
MPATCHDLTSIPWLTAELPEGGLVLGDNAYNSDLDETRSDYYGKLLLLPKRRNNMIRDMPEHQALLR